MLAICVLRILELYWNLSVRRRWEDKNLKHTYNLCLYTMKISKPTSFWSRELVVKCSRRPHNETSGELKQPRRRRQQEIHKCVYLTMKSNRFARFARAFLICDVSQTSSFFQRRERTCFAAVWTTWAYNDKSSILSSYLWSAGSTLTLS